LIIAVAPPLQDFGENSLQLWVKFRSRFPVHMNSSYILMNKRIVEYLKSNVYYL
jgi:hypothetical protein